MYTKKAVEYYEKGNKFLQEKKYSQAISAFKRAIKINKNFVEAHHDLGSALLRQGDVSKAYHAFSNANKILPNHPLITNSVGHALHLMGKKDEAIKWFNFSIKYDPKFAEAYVNLGNTYFESGQFDQAYDFYNKAISLKPSLYQAYSNLSCIEFQNKNYDKALENYRKAIQINPGYAEAFYNGGNVFSDLYQLDEAVSCFQKAIQLEPNYVDAILNLGAAFSTKKMMAKAIECFNKVLSLQPNKTEAYSNRANAYLEINKYIEAIADYKAVLELEPEYPTALGSLLLAKNMICDWEDYERDNEDLKAAIEKQLDVTGPFVTLVRLDSPRHQLMAAQNWTETKFELNQGIDFSRAQKDPKKIRIAYISADFKEHPLSYLMAEVFELHDKNKFEIYGFSLCSKCDDNMHKRVGRAFDEFFDVSLKSDSQIIDMCRNIGIDIAIDLGGHTKHSRFGIFAKRAAPIQIGYLGYLGTLGSPCIDYMIADKVTIPRGFEDFYSEKIIYLPSYQANDTQKPTSDKKFTRKELGIPDNGIVFCCFNNGYKLNSEIFSAWMRILSEVENSVFVLYAQNDFMIENLKRETRKQGIDSDRLIFAKRIPYDDYLARYREMDIFLDTYPYNAGATASDALWSGLPVLTYQGETFSSRVASSLLDALELPELITNSLESYENMAIKLATDGELLDTLKEKLRLNLSRCDLFKADKFTGSLEKAYQKAYQRLNDGLQAEDIFIN